MDKESIAQAWDRCADIVENFYMGEHVPTLNEGDIDKIYRVCDEMKSQARALRAEIVVVAGLHANLLKPNSLLDRNDPPALVEGDA